MFDHISLLRELKLHSQKASYLPTNWASRSKFYRFSRSYITLTRNLAPTQQRVDVTSRAGHKSFVVSLMEVIYAPYPTLLRWYHCRVLKSFLFFISVMQDQSSLGVWLQHFVLYCHLGSMDTSIFVPYHIVPVSDMFRRNRDPPKHARTCQNRCHVHIISYRT